LLTAVVAVTGSAQSPFAFLYGLIVLEAALGLASRGTFLTAVAASVLLLAVTFVQGQLAQSASALAAQVAAIIAMGLLAWR